jgi:hypothetical protein
VIRIEPVRPVNGNGQHRMGSPRQIVVCVALATLISVIPSRSEILSTPTKLSLSPLPAPMVTAADTDHFSLSVEPRPKPSPATAGIAASAASSGDATRRVLEAAAFLDKKRFAAKGTFAALFSTKVGERGFGIAGIQAGYGMVFMDPAFTHGRNGTAMEDRSYIVVKTSLKF